MAKRRLYETEIFCNYCDASPPATAYESSSAAGTWARRHAERTGHESIMRLSFAYKGPSVKLEREIEREARR